MADVTVIWASSHSQNPHWWYGHPRLLILPWRFELGLGLGLQGMPTSLRFWEWGYPKRGDAHITPTTALLPYQLDKDLSSGWRYTSSEQLGSEEEVTCRLAYSRLHLSHYRASHSAVRERISKYIPTSNNKVQLCSSSLVLYTKTFNAT